MVSMLVRGEEGDKIEDGSHPSRSCHVHTGTQAHTYTKEEDYDTVLYKHCTLERENSDRRRRCG